MFDNRQYETLLQWIANYDKFIARQPIESNQRRTAQATRDELQSVLDRLTAHAARPAR
jgi:hypothetical protein